MKLAPKRTEARTTKLAAAQALLERSDSGVSFKGGVDRFEVFSAAVAETLTLPRTWTQQETSGLVRRAIIETVRAGKLEWDNFVTELNKASKDLRSAKLKDYAMWTKINASGTVSKKISFRYDDIELKITSLPPKRFRFEEVTPPNSNPIRWDFPEGGGLIITAQGKFRSDLQAGEGLFQAISDTCALINLAEHRHRRTYRFGEVRPKATLLTAKYHHLFREAVSTHDQGVWYNSDFREDFWRSSPFSVEKIAKSSDYVKRVLRDIKRSPSGDRIRASIRLLYEGWQSHDVNERILWTWTAFETLLSRSTDRADDYGIIKDRALFIAKHPRLEEIALDLAITYRNRFVHENGQCGAAENVAEYLDGYLILIIEWLLQRFVRFESHARFLDMLDAPRDPATAKEQIVDRRRALKTKGNN